MDPSDNASYQAALDDWLENGTADGLVVGWNAFKAQCEPATAPAGADNPSACDREPTWSGRLDAVMSARVDPVDFDLRLSA